MTIKKIRVDGTDHDIHASVADLADRADSASSATIAEAANTASYATRAGSADRTDVADALSPAAKVELKGAVTGSSISGNGWTIDTALAANSVTGAHIVDASVGLDKLANEIGIVVVQSTEPSSSSAAKIWVKI